MNKYVLEALKELQITPEEYKQIIILGGRKAGVNTALKNLNRIVKRKLDELDESIDEDIQLIYKAEVKHTIEQEPLIKAINLYQNERIVDKDRYNQFLDRIESKKIKEYIESELDKKRKQYPNDIILEDKITDKTHVRRTMLNDLNQNKIEEN